MCVYIKMMLIFYLSLLNLLLINIVCFEKDVGLSAPKLIKKYGYPVEIHTATTLDGFNLTLHRIPHGRNLPFSGIPVLVTHSAMCSSAMWVDNLDDSLGFILADEKFDVWLGNFRGNSFTSHSTHARNSHEFWDFTWEDMAEYDVPAFIDYIQKITGYNKILYVGQSMGTLVGFAIFASKLEYNDKIAGFVALAPVASMTYRTSVALNLIQHNVQLFQDITKILDSDKVLYIPTPLLKIFLTLSPPDNFYENFIHLAGGFNPKLRNYTRLPVYGSHCTEGTSVKNVLHAIQQDKNSLLTKFNYGKKENLRRYGFENPPAYNLSSITVPVALFTSANDPFATPLDVQLLKQQLRSVVTHEVMSDPMFSHVDFIWLHPAKDILYGKVIKTLRNMWDNAL